MERNAEFKFMASFAMQSCFDEDICRNRFRMLWTAYCLHYDLDVDTASYDSYIRELWKAVAAEYDEDLARLWDVVSEAGDGTTEWSDYESFDHFMSRYLV